MELIEGLLREFSDLKLMREHFPMWTEWGVEDTSTALHSLGLSYLVTLGQALGCAACAEFPVDDSIRADGIWWERDTGKPAAVFEFERHKGGSELREKVQNLLIAYHRFEENPRILGLICWTKNFYPIDQASINDLWMIFRHGFRTAQGQKVPSAAPQLLRVFEVLHSHGKGGKHLLKQINERRRM